MPYTFNGIGTHYYGAKNRSARVGTCSQCGRSATLSAYDTREWFCLIFIPVIPLTKYRILDDCSSCRRHHRIKAGDFAAELAQTVDPLREAVRRAPRDPAAHIALVEALIGWEMRPEAERDLADARALLPQNIDLLLLEAQMAIDAAEYDRALPLYERAVAIDAQNAEVTYAYGWLLHHLGRYGDAVPILQRAVSSDGNKIAATYLLALSLMKLSRWSEALYAFQQLFGLEPAYAQDKELLRLTRECKQHLGYYPSDAEKRAGRRWWPFGGKRKRAALQAQPALVRPALRIAGLVVLALVLVSLGYYAYDRRANIEIYFDNGLDRAVQVDLDGRRFDLARHSMAKETLRKGPHQVVVVGRDGKEIERLSFTLAELSIFDSITTDRFFVYNVAAKRIYRRGNHGYAARAENSSYSESLIAMKRLIEQRDVDYAFRTPPETISIDSRSSKATRISFNPADDIDLATYALIRLEERNAKEAKSAVEMAAADAPCDPAVRRTQMYVASIAAGSAGAASPVARQWIADCAEDDLEAHRAYQDVSEEAGLQAALLAEYQKMVMGTPDSAKAHYLYGRVLADPEMAAAEYRQAIALDPKLAWGRIALGHAHRQMDRHAEALEELTAAMELEGHDPATIVLYAAEAIATGALASATTVMEAARKRAPNGFMPLHARWLLAAAGGEWETAAAMQRKLETMERPEAAWWRTTHLMRLKGDGAVDSRIEEAVRDEALGPIARHVLTERMIEKGDFEGAIAAIEKSAEWMAPETAALLEVYAAAGLLLEGRVEAGESALAGAEARIASAEESKEKRSLVALVSGVRGSIPVEAVLAAARQADQVEHGWFVAAVRAALANDPSAAAANRDRCIRAASDLDFPYLEVRAMAANLGGSSKSATSATRKTGR